MASKIKIGIIGGSGLDDPDILENRREEYVETIYGKPSDALIHGKINGVDCVLLARHGRKHTINPTNVNYRANIWALKEAGCNVVIASLACGSLKEEVCPGDLVIIDQFIDRTTKREQSFYDGITKGAPAGICHLPLDTPYDPQVRRILMETAKELGIKYHPDGTCVVVEGPRFSSVAESNVFRSWGASVINMTNVPEVMLAKEAGLHYGVVAMATDYDCWRDTGDKVSADAVVKTFLENASKVTEIFRCAVGKLALHDWEPHTAELQQKIKCSIVGAGH